MPYSRGTSRSIQRPIRAALHARSFFFPGNSPSLCPRPGLSYSFSKRTRLNRRATQSSPPRRSRSTCHRRPSNRPSRQAPTGLQRLRSAALQFDLLGLGRHLHSRSRAIISIRGASLPHSWRFQPRSSFGSHVSSRTLHWHWRPLGRGGHGPLRSTTPTRPKRESSPEHDGASATHDGTVRWPSRFESDASPGRLTFFRATEHRAGVMTNAVIS